MSPEASRGIAFINLSVVHCPKCGQKMPFIRMPDSLQQLLWGGWTCSHCGCRMDRWGNELGQEVTGDQT